MELRWSADDFPQVNPIAGPPILITPEMLADAVAKMQPGKAPEPSGVVSEMLNASMKASCAILSKLANTIVAENRIPDDWTRSTRYESLGRYLM